MKTLTVVTTGTPVGNFHLVLDHMDVARASGFGAISELAKRLPRELHSYAIRIAEIHPYRAFIQGYFKGDTASLSKIPRTQDGSEFQNSIWRAISDIGYGRTLSYKQLAAAAEYPNAIRAAGSACGQNRLILLVPCHRILKSDGAIGSYLYGAGIKKYLLEYESTVRLGAN
jgi:methylated-DNA-[protein]-cysteine S-methyltransferase